MSTNSVMNGLLMGMTSAHAESMGFDRGYKKGLAENQHQIAQVEENSFRNGYNRGYNQAKQDLISSMEKIKVEAFRSGYQSGIKEQKELLRELSVLHSEKLKLLSYLKEVREALRKEILILKSSKN